MIGQTSLSAYKPSPQGHAPAKPLAPAQQGCFALLAAAVGFFLTALACCIMIYG
jgi:hypothetical protein